MVLYERLRLALQRCGYPPLPHPRAYCRLHFLATQGRDVGIATRCKRDQIEAVAEWISHVGHAPPTPLLDRALQHRSGLLGLLDSGSKIIGNKVEMHGPWP